MNGWYWIGIGIALAVAEAGIPGITLIWLGGAAVIVGLIALAWPDLTWSVQIGLYAVFAAAAVATGLWLRSRPHRPMTNEVNQGAARFIGQRAELETAIVNGRGQARVGDTVWPVSGPDLPAGAVVTVTDTDGVTLKVTAP